MFFARLLRHFLAKSAQLGRLHQLAEQTRLGVKYLPSTLVLAPDESVPRQVPLVVRDLIGHARRSREVCRVAPGADQPFRASAGMVAETGGVWAFWEEASGEWLSRWIRMQQLRQSGSHLQRGLVRGEPSVLSPVVGKLCLLRISQTLH